MDRVGCVIINIEPEKALASAALSVKLISYISIHKRILTYFDVRRKNYFWLICILLLDKAFYCAILI